MTERQKGLRREARRYGIRAAQYIDHAVEYHKDAVAWGRLAARDYPDPGVAATARGMSEGRASVADKFEANAVANARRAWRYAMASDPTAAEVQEVVNG